MLECRGLDVVWLPFVDFIRVRGVCTLRPGLLGLCDQFLAGVEDIDDV